MNRRLLMLEHEYAHQEIIYILNFIAVLEEVQWQPLGHLVNKIFEI